ncbi:murein L,D-transpeptidase [Flammeovirga sp. SJP92]|uniref:L,D-transpeptidase family protein n=1 Tax=Flammeovirga sp. SJP92 TaxID=1775430 RepID=UPI0007899A34|nr:L,D-transpeptidase family protein [Flammeovirga sp. SJP92]KXX68611.1 hypothetical protein AVL50_22910 [Flammeovirga sp. SJP92]
MQQQTNTLICWQKCIGSIVFFISLLFSNTLFSQQTPEIKTVLQALNSGDPSYGIKIFSDSLMPLIYERREYQPIWTSPKNIEDLLFVINDSYNDGLTPEHYHLKIIMELKNKPSLTNEEKALYDIAMTDAGILLSSHLIWGKVQPETISSTWNFDTKEFSEDRIKLFLAPIEQEKILEASASIRPSNILYTGLRKSLKNFREIEAKGGYTKLQKIESIELGDNNEFIPELRKRLAITGNLIPVDSTVLKVDTTFRSQQEGIAIVNAPSNRPEIDTITSMIPFNPAPILDSAYVTVPLLDTASTLYNENLKQSIIAFQKMYGLEQDGKVGKATLKALNVPISSRINTLRVNMERARWINHEDDDNFIFVNIADFTLYLHKHGEWYYTTNVVVGKPYHQTPVFKAKMSYIDINPTWNVPYSIASKEMLPKLKKDAGYLKRQNMKLYDRANNEIDPYSVDWKTIKQKSFPYYIVQGSGPGNALGYIKFIFPNKYSIYLHDTPSRYLFSRNSRAFSHGCIRVHEPLKLGEQLLKDQGYTLEKIEEIVKTHELKRVILMERPTVYLLYFTAMLGPDVAVHFYDDIYSRDKKVLKELNKSLY